MSITPDGFLDWATKFPGISDKQYSEPNQGLALVGHSIVGSYESALGRFMSTAKDANGNYTDHAAASVMFILRKTGELVQMYPVTASTWTTGGRVANTTMWAIEAEGGPLSNVSEPLTDGQVATLLRLSDEFTARTGRKVVKGSTFREHGEVAKALSYPATACPSNRYVRFYEALNAREAPVTRAEFAELKAAVDRLDLRGIALGKDGQGYDILNANLNEVVLAHFANHPGATKIQPHTHTPGGVA